MGNVVIIMNISSFKQWTILLMCAHFVLKQKRREKKRNKCNRFILCVKLQHTHAHNPFSVLPFRALCLWHMHRGKHARTRIGFNAIQSEAPRQKQNNNRNRVAIQSTTYPIIVLQLNKTKFSTLLKDMTCVCVGVDGEVSNNMYERL